MKTPLVNLLSSLPVRSPKSVIDAWCAQKKKHTRNAKLLVSLGRKITANQAQRLDSLSLSYEALLDGKDGEDFIDSLHKRGVNSKPLREKLKMLISVQPKR